MTINPDQHSESTEKTQSKGPEHQRPANSDISTQKDNNIKQHQVSRDSLRAFHASRDLPKEQRFALVDSTMGTEHTDKRHQLAGPKTEALNRVEEKAPSEKAPSEKAQNGIEIALNFLNKLPGVEQAQGVLNNLRDATLPIGQKAPVMQESHRLADGKNRHEAGDKQGQPERVRHEQWAKHDVPSMLVSHFSAEMIKNFQQLDANHDGVITKEELAKAVADSRFTGQSAQAIASAYANYDKLKDAGSSTKTSGLTIDGLNRFEGSATKLESQACAWCLASRMETGQKLNLNDINNALKNPNLQVWEKKAYEYLKDNYSRFHASDAGLTQQDILKSVNSPAIEEVATVQAIMARTSFSQKADIHDGLYADTKHPLNSIKPEDVQQGRSGDCRFDASIIAIARTHPEMIQQMIREHAGHPPTYTVKFPGTDHAVTVPRPSEAEMGLYDTGSKDGYWPAVLEKAYGQYLLEKIPLASNIAKTPQEAIQWVMSTEALSREGILKDLYGKNCEVVSFTGSVFDYDHSRQVTERIRQAVKAHEPVVIATNPDTNAILAAPLHPGHEYAVTGFDKDGNLVLRNPWGSDVTVKLKDINPQNFYSIVVPKT